MTGRYHVFQPGSINSAQSGCALAVRRAFGVLQHPTTRLGSKKTSEGGGIRDRLILRGHVFSPGPDSGGADDLAFGAAAGHAPPDRAPRARKTYLDNFADVAAKFKGGDLNVAKRVAARLLNRRVIGGGVVWLVLPRRGWKVIDWSMIEVGGDHKAVLAKVRNNKTGRIVRFLVINCMSISTGPKHAASIFANGLKRDPDVIMASECSDFRAAVVDNQENKP